jgi:hypothetical protein
MNLSDSPLGLILTNPIFYYAYNAVIISAILLFIPVICKFISVCRFLAQYERHQKKRYEFILPTWVSEIRSIIKSRPVIILIKRKKSYCEEDSL